MSRVLSDRGSSDVTCSGPTLGSTTTPVSSTAKSPDRSGSRQMRRRTTSPGRSAAAVSTPVRTVTALGCAPATGAVARTAAARRCRTPIIPFSPRSRPLQDGRDRARQDLQVERERPRVDVLQVERDPIVEPELAPPADLPRARHPRRDAEAAHEPRLAEPADVARRQRTWADEGHVALEHIDQLR